MPTTRVPAPFGHVHIQHDEEGLLQRVEVYDTFEVKRAEGPSEVTDPFVAYFEGDPAALNDLRCEIDGTSFQQKVWAALRAIPVGETRTYGQLAQQLGTAAQAVGNAVRDNPIGLVIPCHRVLAANGLGGYCGKRELVQVKRWLLEHEGAEVPTGSAPSRSSR